MSRSDLADVADYDSTSIDETCSVDYDVRRRRPQIYAPPSVDLPSSTYRAPVQRTYAAAEISDEVQQAMAPYKSNLYASRLRQSHLSPSSALSTIASLSSSNSLFPSYDRESIPVAPTTPSSVHTSRYARDLSPATSGYPSLRYRRAASLTTPRPSATPLATTHSTSRCAPVPSPRRSSYVLRDKTRTSSQWCTAGTKVKITCTADTSSGQKVTWYHNDVVLADGDKYSISVRH